MMNRRSFLRFCGIAPIVPALAVGVLEQPDDEFRNLLLETNKTIKNGVYSVYIKAQGQTKWERITANSVELELKNRGGAAYIYNADPTIRIDL